MAFIEKNPGELSFSPFSKIGSEWFLITSGDLSSFNTMTASWGFMGFIWRKNAVSVVVRHSRHTFEFMEKNDLFTCSFLPSQHKDILSFCGSHSGRNSDKIKETGLVPVEVDGCVAFEQADMVLVCRKLYVNDLKKDSFLDPALFDEFYSDGDLHKAYIAEIVKVYVKE